MPDTSTPAQADEKARHAVADAINRARYRGPTPGLPERGLDEEDPSSKEYAFRLADAAIAALRPEGEAVARDGAVGWNSAAEWELEQQAFHAAGRDDVPEDVQKLVAALWKQYCIAAEPLASPPAPAGVKALESWIAAQALAILAMYRFDSEDDLRRAREAFDILKVRAPQFLSLLPPSTEAHPDDLAVDRFAAAMKTKLAKKRAEGRGGWEDKDDCSNAFLSQLLREHTDKGDPVDVGNLAMMIHQRGERIG